MQLLTKLLLSATFIYTALALSVYLLQNRLVYAPDRNVQRNPSALNLPFEEVTLKSSSDAFVHGWYVPYEASTYTVLFCHGNAGNIADRLELIKVLHSAGLSVFIFDYAGYGQSTGKPSEQQTYEDARAAWDYLTVTRKIEAERIIILGRSLGGGVATQLAVTEKPAGVVLESTFTSIPDIGARLYPWLPVRWLSRVSYDNLARMSEIRVPILIMHSRDDEVIPYSHAQSLLAASPGGTLHRTLNGKHSDAYFVDPLGYAAIWRDFVRSLKPA